MIPDVLSEARLKKNSSTLFITEAQRPRRCTENAAVSVKSPCPLCLRGETGLKGGVPLRALKMGPGVVALKELLPQGFLLLVVNLRIVSYGIVPLHLSDNLPFHAQNCFFERPELRGGHEPRVCEEAVIVDQTVVDILDRFVIHIAVLENELVHDPLEVSVHPAYSFIQEEPARINPLDEIEKGLENP